MPQEPIIGIDLGTTFSAVATIDEYGRPVVLQNSEGRNITPSVIAFAPDSIKFGTEAKSIQKNGDTNVASFFKRRMGDAGYVLEFFGKEYNSQKLSVLLLKKLKEDAELALGQKVSKAVITVPAYFDDCQRTATKQAGEEAGLTVLRIINEPTAAAIAYGIDKVQNQTLLVYDLGGGTFDVTIVKVTDGAISVIGTDGDHQLGGKDWDSKLINYVASRFQEEHDADLLNDSETVNELTVLCEEVKKTLSELGSANITIRFDGNKGKYIITREKFEDLTADLVEQTKTLCNNVVEEAKLTWQDIDGVLLVGGSTRMPMIEKTVEALSEKKPIHGVNVDEAVACGAAIMCADILSKLMPKAQLAGKPSATTLGRLKTIQDVTSHSLGMIAENADRSKYINAIILPRNSAIPCQDVRPLSFRTSAKNVNECDVYLMQGESSSPGDCSILGKYVFSDIQHEKDGKAVIDITYRYDENGIVAVSGRQRSTGKELTLRREQVPEDMNWIYGSPKDHTTGKSGHVAVIIAVDVSGSMAGRPMVKAKNAAKQFLEKIDLSCFSVGIMAVADRTAMLCELSQNAKEVEQAIDSLDCGVRKTGYGNSAHPFDKAKEKLNAAECAKFIIVLADGVWDNQPRAVRAAKGCHAADIGVVALGFGWADKQFLRDVASCDENALFTDLSKIGDSFSTIAQVLTEGGGERCKIFAK